MSLSVNIQVTKDTASPAVRKVLENCTPQRMGTAMRDPLVSLTQRHFQALPPNKMGFTSTGFWSEASSSTHGEVIGSGVIISTGKIGVRQRYFGGVIKPVNKQYLALPARAEAYGKSPREFDNLICIDLGRQQGAPRLVLVEADASRVSIGRKKKDGTRTVQNAGETGGGIMFWLVKQVVQQPDPNIIPSDAEFLATIEQSLKQLLPS